MHQLSLAWKKDALTPFYAIRFEFKIFLFFDLKYIQLFDSNIHENVTVGAL